MYCAAVLTEEAQNQLREAERTQIGLESLGFIYQIAYPLPHHMTINLGEFDSNLNSLEILDQCAELRINQLVINHTFGICAAPVISAQAKVSGQKWIDIHSMNDHPHITCCLKPGVKPMVSNQLLETKHGDTEFWSIPEMVLDAKVQIV